MKKSSEPSDDIRALSSSFTPRPPDLELPIDPDFVSRPPRLPWRVIYERSLERLPQKLSRPEFVQRRLAERIDVEFVL